MEKIFKNAAGVSMVQDKTGYPVYFGTQEQVEAYLKWYVESGMSKLDPYKDRAAAKECYKTLPSVCRS